MGGLVNRMLRSTGKIAKNSNHQPGEWPENGEFLRSTAETLDFSFRAGLASTQIEIGGLALSRGVESRLAKQVGRVDIRRGGADGEGGSACLFGVFEAFGVFEDVVEAGFKVE